MDPDETLAQLRQLFAERVPDPEPFIDDDPRDTLDRAEELFTALDQWLSSGGFKPAAWED